MMQCKQASVNQASRLISSKSGSERIYRQAPRTSPRICKYLASENAFRHPLKQILSRPKTKQARTRLGSENGYYPIITNRSVGSEGEGECQCPYEISTNAILREEETSSGPWTSLTNKERAATSCPILPVRNRPSVPGKTSCPQLSLYTHSSFPLSPNLISGSPEQTQKLEPRNNLTFLPCTAAARFLPAEKRAGQAVLFSGKDDRFVS
ncbi:hypothetical protein F4679DRAFT_559107 [Xylaria curta]|nr:hypothetical protein F4679DRAFT_559107 [Xylaria curta]